MAAQFHKIAVLGATGNLGRKIVKALTKAHFEVTAIQRHNGNTDSPSGVKSTRVDLLSRDELASAFKGHDVVVSAVPSPICDEQQIMLDAAIQAGVKRVVPSEFSSNLEAKAKTDRLPNVLEKLRFRELVVRAASEGRITWSSINNGPFLDLGVKWGMFGPNVHKGQAVYHDGGAKVVCATTTDDIGEAVALMLQHPIETENRAVYVYSAAVTEQKMCAVVTKLTGRTLTVVHADVEAEYDEYRKDLEKGDPDPRLQFRPYYLMMYGKGYGGDYRAMAMNEAIGLRVMDDVELERSAGTWLAEMGIPML